ncbi:MarR family winged helix-turn-helix transcriptional regulator [Nocardia beijingensis]|uniref:MarR family winged helix-turn-helix transcriptional regulator n=1 Tax=Nocardia beijingensis TaxID=95162 RepID=UPI0008312FCA|nr:MarR family transcriptional regulator [Nocardia beijingensis]
MLDYVTEPRWLNEREMRLWQNFLAAGVLVEREIDQDLKREGLSHTQYEVLSRLSASPDQRLRMTELADAMFSTKSGLSYQIAQLEKAGLVRRETCSSDVRGVIAILTPAGRHRLEATAPAHVTTVRRILVDILTAEQQQAIAAGLEVVVSRLTAEGSTAKSSRPVEAAGIDIATGSSTTAR